MITFVQFHPLLETSLKQLAFLLSVIVALLVGLVVFFLVVLPAPQERLHYVEEDVFTIEHDGHLFIVASTGNYAISIIPHPDCPKCLKRKEAQDDDLR